MNKPGSVIEDIHVHKLPDFVPIQGIVSIGQHISHGVLRYFCRNTEILEIRLRFSRKVPCRQKHKGKAFYRLPFEHQRRILPLTEPIDLIDIFIGEIHSTGKCRFSIDHHDFTVISVIIVCGNKRSQGREHPALDAQFFQSSGIIGRKFCDLAGTIVDHPDIHTLPSFSGKDLQDLPPHDPLIDDKVFQKDKVFRFIQLPEHGLQHILTQRKIADIRITINGITPGALDIVRYTGSLRAFFLHLTQYIRILSDQFLFLLCDLFRFPFQFSVPCIHLTVQIEQRTENRKDADDNDPGDFCRGIHGTVDHDERHDRIQSTHNHHVVRHIVPQTDDPQDNQSNLQQQQQDYDSGTAEQHGQKALPAAFQQLDAIGVEVIIDFGFFQNLLYVFFKRFHDCRPLNLVY